MESLLFFDKDDHTNDPAPPPLTASEAAIAKHAMVITRLIEHSHKHHDKIARLERLVDALLERVAELEARR